ncbi:MAG: hypothetical protein ACXWLM_01330 [Myxococcales bacterium]
MRKGGWGAVRSDFRHYSRVHGAHSLARKLLLPLAASSLVALAVYRYGSWVHYGSRVRALPHRALYRVLSDLARYFTKVMIPVWAEIDEGVWLGSHAPLLLGGHLGRGVSLHAGVTLGMRVGGPQPAEAVPEIGPGVVVGPGASITGAVRIPAGAVIGPNTVVSRSLPGGAWIGIPPGRWAGSSGALFPSFSGD